MDQEAVESDQQVEIIISTEDLDQVDTTEDEDVYYVSIPTHDALMRDLLCTAHHQMRRRARLRAGDTVVRCADGSLRAPAPLLGAACPVFRSCAGARDADDILSLVLPDVTVRQFGLFLKYLCLPDRAAAVREVVAASASGVTPDEDISEDLEALRAVLEVVAAEFVPGPEQELVDSLLLLDASEWTAGNLSAAAEENKKPLQANQDTGGNKENKTPAPAAVTKGPPKKRGRKRKSEKDAEKPPEPYIKTELVEKPRRGGAGESGYGLRKKIKRIRFADEVSDPEGEAEEEKLDIAGNDDDDEEELKAGGEADSGAGEENKAKKVIEEERDDESDEEEDVDEVQERIRQQRQVVDEKFNRILVPGGLRKKVIHYSVAVRILKDGTVKAAGLTDEEEETGASSTHGRLVAVMEDHSSEEGVSLNGEMLKAPKSNPRSLLKAHPSRSSTSNDPLVFVCSASGSRHDSMRELRRHAAANYPDSRFFKMPKNHPHADTPPCRRMMSEYLEILKKDISAETDVLFKCPYCRRRFAEEEIDSLWSHLERDHRVGESGVVQDEKEPLVVLVSSAPDHRECESPPARDLFCWVCGKVFARERHLRTHLLKHGRGSLEKMREFPCADCPVHCESESSLARHKEKEHSSGHSPDLELHPGCERCGALQKSYRENRKSGKIPDHDLAFKCPHCHMVILPCPGKNPARYLINHVSKFHLDPATNDLTLPPSPEDASKFRVLSRFSDKAELLSCDLCRYSGGGGGTAVTFASRHGHNEHVASCESYNAVPPCRPGYLCGACGHVAATSARLRLHLETQHSERELLAGTAGASGCVGGSAPAGAAVAGQEKGLLSCSQCQYVGKTSRLLSQHVRRSHSSKHRPKRKPAPPVMVPCSQCGREKRAGTALRSHERRCGGGGSLLPQPRVKCPDCPMEFKRKEDMQAHALVHYGQVTCPIHNILFKTESEVFQHANQASPTDPRPRLQCCMCSSAFRHMCHFMKHLRRHLRIRAYRCGLCNKHFHSYPSLQVHQHSQHGLKPEQQQQQDAARRRKRNDKKEVVDDEAAIAPAPHRVFHCELCSKSFSTKGHLKEHVLGVHEGSNQVHCPLCDKTFNTAKRMKKHLYNTHKESADGFRAHSRVEAFAEQETALLFV